jgi:hypothetical protein
VRVVQGQMGLVLTDYADRSDQSDNRSRPRRQARVRCDDGDERSTSLQSSGRAAVEVVHGAPAPPTKAFGGDIHSTLEAATRAASCASSSPARVSSRRSTTSTRALYASRPRARTGSSNFICHKSSLTLPAAMPMMRNLFRSVCGRIVCKLRASGRGDKNNDDGRRGMGCFARRDAAHPDRQDRGPQPEGQHHLDLLRREHHPEERSRAEPGARKRDKAGR